MLGYEYCPQAVAIVRSAASSVWGALCSPGHLASLFATVWCGVARLVPQNSMCAAQGHIAETNLVLYTTQPGICAASILASMQG
jgi:hypothetical protein